MEKGLTIFQVFPLTLKISSWNKFWEIRRLKKTKGRKETWRSPKEKIKRNQFQ